MVWYILLFLFSPICVINSLKCRLCEFKLKIGNSIPDESTWPEECTTIDDDDIVLCKGYIEIDYITENVYIWWNPVREESLEDISSILDLPLPLTQTQKSLTKFRFDIQFKPDEEFGISSTIFCHLSDFCIMEESDHLLSQLSTLKHVSTKIRKDFENILIKTPSESNVMCFHSFSNKIIECTTSNDPAACFTGIRDGTSDNVAGCARDAENLFVSVSYYVINPMSSIRGENSTCSIHCNRNNCNTKEVYTNVINIAQKYISGFERPHRRRRNKIV